MRVQPHTYQMAGNFCWGAASVC